MHVYLYRSQQDRSTIMIGGDAMRMCAVQRMCTVVAHAHAFGMHNSHANWRARASIALPVGMCMLCVHRNLLAIEPKGNLQHLGG